MDRILVQVVGPNKLYNNWNNDILDFRATHKLAIKTAKISLSLILLPSVYVCSYIPPITNLLSRRDI